MTEIWNLNTLCRCCHSDGCFKSLNLPYQGENGMEMYEIMLQKTFAITISRPPLDASYTICDECIKKLRDASLFREQVITCESKFQIYCTNEQFLNSAVEFVKTEIESNDNEDDDNDVNPDDLQPSDDIPPEDNKSDINFIKEEIEIEVDVKYPIDQVKKIENNDIINNATKHKGIENVELKKIEIKNKKNKNKQIKKVATNRRRIAEEKRRKLYEPYIIQVKTKTGATYSCKTCEGSYRAKNDLFKHIRWQHLNVFKCEECGMQFRHSAHLKRHAQLHVKDPFICRHCGTNFPSKKTLREHAKIHKKDLVYQCDTCLKEFKYKSTLRKHIIQIHSTENKELLCDVCGWSFKQRSNLEAHIRTVHLKQRPYACTVCGKTYTAKKHVKNHMKITHSGNPRQYECDLCNKRYAYGKSLEIHRMTHENVFVCRYCPVILKSKEDFYAHLKTGHARVPAPNNTFACNLCGKLLITKFNLNRHLEIHYGIKRFSCNICGMKFNQKAQLKRHNRRKHEPNAKIEKTILRKKIDRRINKGVRDHDSGKPKVSCDICGKSYTGNNVLTRHKNETHFGLSFDCDICGKKYIKKKSLETHKLKKHKIKKEIDERPGSSEDMEMTNVT